MVEQVAAGSYVLVSRQTTSAEATANRGLRQCNGVNHEPAALKPERGKRRRQKEETEKEECLRDKGGSNKGFDLRFCANKKTTSGVKC
jgi:hypothetical protein